MRVGLNRGRSSFGPARRNPPPLLIALVALLAGLVGWMLRGPQGELIRQPARYVKEQYTQEIKRLNPPALPEIRLELSAPAVSALRAKREEALEIGILYAAEDDFVDARIHWEERRAPCRVRLKGDWPEHLKGEDWSFRVKISGDDAVMGMRVFSLQHPRTRNYDLEWLYLEHLRAEGLLAPRYGFAHLIVNDEDKGVYAVEEHFSKELLESQGRREGVIVRLDESDYWKRAAIEDTPGLWKLRPDDFRHETPAVFRPSVTERSPALSEQRNTALSMLNAFQAGDATASEVFKADELARFLALSETWSAWHAVRWHNLRFYYDPLECLLEPIGFDATIPCDAERTWVVLGEDWARQALSDPLLAGKFVQELERISAPDYPGELKDRLEETRAALRPAMLYEDPTLTARAWEIFEAKQKTNRELLGLEAIAAGWISRKDQSELVAHLHSTVSLPVEVLGIRIEGSPIHNLDLPDHLEALSPNLPPKAVQVQLFQWARPAGEYSLVCRLAGAEGSIEIPLADYRTGDAPLIPHPPSISEAMQAHDFLVSDGDSLMIPRGEWLIEQDLITPQGVTLAAMPGARLRFSRDTALIANGPLNFQGTAQEPVILSPLGERWCGIFVIGADESRWEFVLVEKTTGIARGGWQPTGGVTFFKSDVQLDSCRFIGSTAEDQLNLVRAEARIGACSFSGAESDIIDGDFADVRISGSTFRDCGGDALDFSGSRVYLSNLVVEDAGDKAVSAGERTLLNARGLDIRDVRMGVVSKDLSDVTLEDSSISEAAMGLAVYIKKREYGPAMLRASNIPFANVAAMYIVQRGSELWVEDKRIVETDFDAAELYEQPND